MHNSHVPRFVVAGTFYSWTFVNGAFGKTVKRPWDGTICGPFWQSLFMLTLGLPVTLLGWLIRLTFGHGRAERFGDFVYKKSTRIGALAFGILTLLALLVIGLVFWVEPILTVFKVIGILAGGFIISVLLIIGLCELEKHFNISHNLQRKFRERKMKKQERAKSMRVQHKEHALRKFAVWYGEFVWKLIKKLLGIVKFIFWTISLRFIVGFFVFLALMVHAAYKKYCPLVHYE